MSEKSLIDDVVIEPMTRNDVPAVHAMECACFSSPWTIEAYYGELMNPTAQYLVARLDGVIVGFIGIWVVADEAHIATIAVDPAVRRRGVGRKLIIEGLKIARQRGATVVSLEVRVGNHAAIELYRSFGFQVIGYRRRYYPDNGEDAAVMMLSLDE